MDTAGDPDAFHLRVRQYLARMGEVRATREPGPLLAELRAMVDDLAEAGEELRVQHQELRASQIALARLTGRYQELFDAAPVAYLVTDSAGRIMEANRASAVLLGWPPERGLNVSVTSFCDAPSARRLREMLVELRRQGGAAGIEVTLRPDPATGVRRLVQLTVAESTDPLVGERTLRWAANPVRESPASAARPAHREPPDPDRAGRLQNSLRLLDVLLDGSAVEVVVVDAGLRVRRASRSITGGVRAEGLTLSMLLGPAAIPLEPIVSGCLEHAWPVRDVEVTGCTPADPGRTRSWRVSFVPLPGGPGRADGVGLLLAEPRRPDDHGC
jgi:PAS domain S-box-containing protein